MKWLNMNSAWMKWIGQDPLRKRTEELALAISLLTRFPLPPFERRSSADLGSAFWAYPVIGALIGGLGVAVFWLAKKAAFGTAPALLMAMCAMVLAGGAFHEDGLADFWDGIGGGRSREAKLEIMRDSRIGTYGVLALFFFIGLQALLFMEIHAFAGTGVVAGALVATEALARGAIALPLVCLSPARKDGLAATIEALPSGALLAGCALSVIIAAGALGMFAWSSLLGAGLGAAAVTVLAWWFLGGFTGDVLGAAAAAARISALAALAWAIKL